MKNRLAEQPGEWIDRGKSLTFRFEGREYVGCEGDTLSSALAANGVRVLGRSFKYHRPRGILSLANHDCNALMQDCGRLNIRADVTPLWGGADLRAVNAIGGLKSDRAAIIDRFGAFLPVGFYYKAFHNPRRLFPFYERRMREMAGLGAVDTRESRLRTPKRYDFCDVLVVGAGPAGLSAAIAAAMRGARTVLVDENARPGGTLGYQWASEPGAQAGENLRSLLERAAGLPNLSVRTSTQAAGYYADHWIALIDDVCLTKVRARSVVIATGSCELPAVFRHNDLPGVMLASAAQRLLRRYAVRPFEAGIVLTANSDGYRAALDLHGSGVRVAAIVDLRPTRDETDLAERARAAGILCHRGHAVCEAVPSRDGVRGAVVAPLDESGQPQPAKRFTVPCDGIAMSVGWAAADGLFCQAGGKTVYSDVLNQFVPSATPAGLFLAGRVNAVYTLPDQLADGERAGGEAAVFAAGGSESSGPRRAEGGSRATAGVAASPSPPPVPPDSADPGRAAPPARASVPADAAHLRHAGPPPSHAYPIFPHPAGKCFVDMDEDVQYKDLVHSAQEGFDSAELMKRYSTYGMGPSQGKIANVNAIRILAKTKGQTVAETGTTTARPFYHPAPMSHLAGRGFHPHRVTALHDRHEALDAELMMAGEWLRPACYRSDGKPREQAIREEVTAVRQRVGLIDVGTLGKIEISGAGAGEFIERIYTGRFAKMRQGTSRYGLMCDETGVVIDDGVVARLAADRYYVTTTTTASGAVYREMQRWALLWGLEVTLANVTGAYAAMNLAGPHSRRVLAGLTDCDLSPVAFPYLGARESSVAGVAARLLRVGFVGELGYEIHVPSSQAAWVWNALLEAGQRAGIRPFGVEAQRILRLEKGHVIVGQDTDGLTSPPEAGMEWAVKADKPFFVGQRSLAILGKRPAARRLAGFTLASAGPEAGVKECHLVIANGQIAGRVTSIAVSPTLQKVIGLAYLPPARTAPGTTFTIRVDSGALVVGVVAQTPFYDPKNARQDQPDPEVR
jgi:sarcosine oxidase subunit alpha